MHKFTQEQLHLAELIAEGLTFNEIADRLGVSPATAKARTDKLRWTLGVSKKRHVPHRMKELGLIK